MLHLDDHIAEFCTLSIRLAPDGFSFFVLNEKLQPLQFHQGQGVPFQDTTALALRALGYQGLESLPFKEVHVLLDYPEATCIPYAFYDDEKKDEAFSFHYDLSPREFVVNNHCSAYGLELLFPIPKNVYEYFGGHFKNYRFVHRLSLLLHQANTEELSVKERLYIAYAKDHFTAVGIRNNGLIYHNIFTLNSDEDLIYYLLLVFQELKFDQYNAQVLIDGCLSEDHQGVKVIKEYVQNVDFTHYAIDAARASCSSDPQHYHTALFQVSQCEL